MASKRSALVITPGARPNLRHPLLRGAIRVFDPRYAFDLVSRTAWSKAGTTPIRSYTVAPGLSVSTGNAWYLPTTLPSGAWTMLVLMAPNVALSNSAAASAVGFSDGGLSGATTDRAIIYNSGKWGGYVFTTSSQYVTSNTASKVGYADAIVLSNDGATMAMAVNGADYASTSVVNFGFTGYASPNFCVGSAGGSYGNHQVAISFAALIGRSLSKAEALSWSRNPWQVYAEHSRKVFLGVATGGGGATINGSVGDAVANGTTAAVRRTIATQTGNASADGVTATARQTISTSAGNAVADGSNAQITTGSGTTINTVTGNAVAAGSNAGVNISIAVSVGNAAANGVLAALVRSIPAAVGNAVANGVAASISTNTIIAGLIGNAVANGVTASITNAEAGTLNATDLAAISALIDAKCASMLNVWINKMITDPVAGTWTIYADDDVTPLYSGPLYEDAAGTQPYRGRGAEHRGKNTI